MSGALDHHKHIASNVLGRDEPGFAAGAPQSAHAETAALAERVALESAMAPDDGAVRGLDPARAFRQPAPDEIAERALSDEADPGRIALFRDRQAPLAGNRPHLGLPDPANREFTESELGRIQRVQEIALVLVVVDPALEPPSGPDPRVMAGREALCAESSRVVEPHAELDLTVAEDIRVRRAPGLELGQEARENALAIFRREAGLVQRYAQFAGDASSVLEIRRRRAIAPVVLDPVRHEQGLDAVAGILEQGRGDGRVHAAGKRDDDVRHESARGPAKRVARHRYPAQHLERIALAQQVVFDATQDQRTAMLGGARQQLFAVEPQGADDGAIERRARNPPAEPARERDSQHGAASRALPEVETGDGVRPEFVRGFLARLAHDGLDQRLPILEMSGGLVQYDATRGAFLYEQEPAALFGDGRDRQIDLQGHESIIERRGDAEGDGPL